MATVMSESEQPLDNKLINGSLAENNPDLQPASSTVAGCDAEVCAQGSGVKGATEPSVPSSPASENSSPHGAALSPRNKDESGMSCNRKFTADEQKTDVLFENNGDLVSAEPATDCGETSDLLHNENIGKYNFAPRADSKCNAALSLRSLSLRLHTHTYIFSRGEIISWSVFFFFWVAAINYSAIGLF